MDEQEVEGALFGLEVNLMTQEQVVSEFRELVSKDLAVAALRYNEFADKLEAAASDGNAQVRSMIGGPDSLSRAGLIDVMVGNYSTASDDVKLKILELATGPLLRDNSFYIQLAVARMTNPYIVADIIRKYPSFNPGANFYEDDFLRGDNLSSAGSIQAWLDKFAGDNLFAASTIAMQLSNPTDIATIIEANQELFESAAHVVASRHASAAESRVEEDPSLVKSDLLEEYRSSYVDEFKDMIRVKLEAANWLPMASLVKMEDRLK